MLSAEREKEMGSFCRHDQAVAVSLPIVSAYCAKVSIMGRKPDKAEYDACQSWMKDQS
jgi:hypothetical protein